MKPKFILSAVFAVSSLLVFLLPQLGSPASASAHRAGLSQAAMSIQAAVQAPAPQPAIASSAGISDPAALPPMAQTGRSAPAPAAGLEEFAARVINNEAGVLTGVYVPGLFALPVVQQPNGSSDYVSPEDATLTQYGAASSYGSIGILAHNYLAGQSFFRLSAGQEVVLVYGDGAMALYRIEEIEQYQALSPDNVYSDFVNLDDPSGAVLPFTEVFNRFYSSPGQVVFQTCIANNGSSTWGRIFVVARPVQ